MEVIGAKKPYEAIPEIFLPDEDKYCDDENDCERGQRRENWLQNLAACLEIAARRRLYDDRDRRLFCRGVAERAWPGSWQFVQPAETAGHLRDQAIGGAVDRLDLVVHR